jgi:hypothetical protein
MPHKRWGFRLKIFYAFSVEEKLARLDETFLNAADHVLSKNAELYKRLA